MTKLLRARVHSLRAVLFLLTPAALLAQSAANPPPDDTVHLNPFEVTASAKNSYSTMNSNSLTAFNIALDRIPATADILDETFLKDVDALSVEASISSYDAGANFAAANVGTVGESLNQPGDHSSAAVSLWVRGFPISGLLTNGLQLNFGNAGQTSFGNTSNYDIERVEVIEGPQALLYTGGGPGGAINVETKQAYLGQPSFGEARFRLDQYGSKYATFDYGAGTKDFAVRVALADGTTLSRRVNVGDSLYAGYVQVAAVLGNTTFRLSLQQSIDTRMDNNNLTLSSTGDPVYAKDNGLHLEYLLASNQAQGIMGGGLNWNNVESLAGIWQSDIDLSESAMLEIDSTWTGWLSTKLEVAGANFNDDNPITTVNFDSPGATANPLPGNWTVAMPASSPPVKDTWRPKRNKSASFNALVTNSLFGGRATSRSSFEADYCGNLNSNAYNYSWYQSDASGNAVLSASGARIGFPAQAWTVNNGPQLYEVFTPVTGVTKKDIINYGGTNYVRQLITPFNPAAPADADGVSSKWNSGMSVLNDTQWMDGKLDTLVGARYDHSKTQTANEDATEMRKPDFSGGVVYHALSWLAPYLSVSDFWQPGGAALLDGSSAQDAHTTSIEAGVKLNTDGGKLSGSLSAYRSIASNFTVTSPALAADVNPAGLNGSNPGSGSNTSADIQTYGFTAVITANPVPHWRMRLSAAFTPGKFTKGAEVNQLYNDQFHADSAGNVTYADGTIVFVPATFNKSQLTVPQGTVGAVPLTVTLLSTPGGQYFANPQPITGAIQSTSNGGLVLTGAANPTHGSILTGALGLPNSNYQLNTTLSGVQPFGSIQAAIPGDSTWGYPEIGFNFTSVYEIPAGALKGLRFGGTASVAWRDLITYYYPTTTNLAPGNELKFYQPVTPQFDLIAGYTRKIGRLTWSIQLNIHNMFNHYTVVEFPNPVGGYSSAANITANFIQQPRSYALTNTVRF